MSALWCATFSAMTWEPVASSGIRVRSPSSRVRTWCLTPKRNIPLITSIRTYMRNFNLNVGLAPGMVVFLNNYSALEVNVGVLGFSYNHNRQTSDRIYVSNVKTKFANFKINLFSITFGCAFYL